MNYSTELPPNVKTWNELLTKDHVSIKRTDSTIHVNYEPTWWKIYSIDYVKARCLDEIMELLASMPKPENDVNQEDSLYMCHFLVSRLSALTHTKLFK